MKYLTILIFTLSLAANCTANKSSDSKTTQSSEIDNPPSRWELRRSLYEKGEILIIYDAENKTTLTAYDLLFSQLNKKTLGRRNRDIKIQHKLASEINEEDTIDKVLFLIGTAQANPLISKLTKDMPLSFSKGGIDFNEKYFDEKGDILSSSYYPNPQNEELPFLLITGNDDLTILQFVKGTIEKQRFLNQTMDIEIYRTRDKIAVGAFDRQWKINPNAFFDFTHGTDTILTTPHFEYITHDTSVSTDAILPLSSIMEESVKSMQMFFNSTKSLPQVGIHIYKSAEVKGLLLGLTQQSHLDLENKLSHIVYNDKYKGNFLQTENILFLRELIGAPNQHILETGLGIYFTKQWQREGYLYWAARLAASDNAYTLSHFLEKDLMDYESPLIKDCMSATLVSFLIEYWGKDTFKSKYLNWSPNKKELIKAEDAWQVYLKKLVKQHPRKTRKSDSHPYYKGFNFAHEGYSIYNGYLSSLATESLKKQKSLGANAIAIVPYTGMRDPHKPVPLRISSHAGSENVEGIIHSAYEAKKLGMVSMLKPQIWLSGSWPGDIKMKSTEEWDEFFDHYQRWILHFALIAEIHDIEMFCVGVEFSSATLKKEKKWRELFKSVRALYQGKLTYAANWGDEFEKVQFWDELDFIGLNCYYPLSKSDKPSDKELKENFSKIKDKIRQVYNKHNKPVLFTEIGFRSNSMPWKNPHAEGNDTYNPEDQARCYELIFDGIKNEPWCNGMLWWKFPSYLDYRGVENNAFTPNNKKAEKVIKKWFSK